MPHAFTFVVLFGGLVVGPLMGQGWVDRTGPNGPAPRFGHTMCYDAARGYTLMAGGSSPNVPGTTLDDVWSWDGTVWTQRGPTPVTGLGAGDMTLVVHPPSSTVVLLTINGLAWRWDGSAWLITTSPGIGGTLATAYDPIRQQTMVVSNSNPGIVRWFDGQTWSSVVSATTPLMATCNPPSHPQVLLWDAQVGRIVLMTQSFTSASSCIFTSGIRTYEWSGYAWNQRISAAPPLYCGSAAFDVSRARTVAFDGDSLSLIPNHTWMYSGGAFARLGTTVEPTLRRQSAMAYDASRGVTVLFGGNAPSPNGAAYPMGDTWEFDLGQLASFSAFGSGCLGSRGVPTIASQAGSAPRIGTTFTAQIGGLPWNTPAFLFVGLSDTSYGGVPLPFSLNLLGAPGCTLFTSCEELHLLTNVLGSAQWSFQVPPVPGASFYTQVFPLDSVNALGLTASNGARGVIGL